MEVAILDAGRLVLLDGRRLLGWSPGTRLGCRVTNHVLRLVLAGPRDVHVVTVDRSTRVGLPLSLRRRLGIAAADRVLVWTRDDSVPQVLVVPLDRVAEALVELAHEAREGWS
jgi:bifunctional DNA-binding transcriptional regulator/antitoxin component of YhaV-PrlF toxin-antitoxin module